MRHGGAGIMVVGLTVLTTPGMAAPPDAAALVRQVREREAWVETVESLRIRAVQHWERTRKGIEHERRRLERMNPGLPLEGHPNLRPRFRCTIELAYDRTRIRLRVQDEGYSDDLRIWDGKRFLLQNRYVEWPGQAPDQDGTLYKGDLSMLSWLVWSNFATFRAGPHLFWWNSPAERAEIERRAPRPEDFAYEGQSDFQGIPCHVVSHWDSWTSLFIGVDDGRLHGLRLGSLTTAKLKQSLMSLFRELGRPVKDEADMENQAPPTKEEQARLKRLGAARLSRLIDPVFEYRLSLNKEVAPGCRLPLVQAIHFFESDERGQAFESQRNELRIVEAKVNQPLPDALFTVTLKEGEWISDQTHDPQLRYRHKASFGPEEWAAIVAEAESRARQQAERRKAARKRQGREK